MNEPEKYGAFALDPLHIGAGGYRLGRVDNTIVRDPTTDVPKIPGTSISGVIREYQTLYLIENDDECKKKTPYDEKRKCSEEKVRAYFGDEKRQGMLRFYDAQILFFPVSSIQGTVWITTKELLEDWLGDLKDNNGGKLKVPEKIEDTAYILKGFTNSKPLNLGWLMLDTKGVSDGKELVLPKKINDFAKRIVAVSDKLFSHIINDNLEVRTSVKINPETGTAEDGALFTYEAIPRGTILGFEIVKDRRKGNKDMVEPLIEATFPYLKLIGVGGMGTRGFGRIDVFNLKEKGNDNKSQSGGK